MYNSAEEAAAEEDMCSIATEDMFSIATEDMSCLQPTTDYTPYAHVSTWLKF